MRIEAALAPVDALQRPEPPWTEQRGDWTFDGSTAVSQSAAIDQELTRDGPIDDATCVDVVAVASLTGTCYAGPIVRHSGQGASASYL